MVRLDFPAMSRKLGEFSKSKIAGQRQEAKPLANGPAQSPPNGPAQAPTMRVRRRVVFTPARMSTEPPTKPSGNG